MTTKLKFSMFALGLLLAFGCSQEEEPTAAAEAPVEAPEQVAAPTAAAPGGGSETCERAADCCSAYIEAVASAQGGEIAAAQGEAACQGVRQAAQAGTAGEPACTQAIAGWRQALTAMSVTVPTACAE